MSDLSDVTRSLRGLTCLNGHSACADYEQVEIIYHQCQLPQVVADGLLVILPIALFFFTMHWLFGMVQGIIAGSSSWSLKYY